MDKYIGVSFDEILKDLDSVIQEKQQELNENSYIVSLCYNANEKKDLKITYNNLIRGKGYAKNVNLYYYFSCFCEAFIGEKALNGRNLSAFPISISAKGNVRIDASLHTILILLSIFLRILDKNQSIAKDIWEKVRYAINDINTTNGATLENLLKHLDLIVN